MKIIDRWNEIMGPKDERLAAEANRCAAIGYTILIIGSALCLYYGIMLNQVAETTGHPLLTPLGQSVFPVDTALLIVILGSGLISTYLQVRSGAFDTHARIVQSDRIPWTTWPWWPFCAASDWASPQQPCAFSRKCRSSA